MRKYQAPTLTQANGLFFLTAALTLMGSYFFQPRLGLGTNVWINELVYILLPPLLLAKAQNWSLEEIYSFKSTSRRNCLLSALAAIPLWFSAFYISRVTRLFLDKKVGVLVETGEIPTSLYQDLLAIIAVVVLAPICEEIFFRGFVQAAYSRHNKRYGLIVTGILFGVFHIYNGLSEAIPATILGIAMGYLVAKTGSLASSMFFHATANLSSVFLAGLLSFAAANRIPTWMHLAAPLGVILSVVVLRNVEGTSENTVEEERKPIPAQAIVFLILTALLFLATGAGELLLRLEWFSTF